MATTNWLSTLDADGNIHLDHDTVVPFSHFIFRNGPRICEDPSSDKAEKRKKGLGFEYAEHAYIGDFVSLTLKDGTPILGKDHILTLTNGLQVTFGQINGLAGDFYGTKFPISDGKDLNAQGANFELAFNALDGKSSKMPGEAKTILGLLADEVTKINAAVEAGINPSTVYATLPDLNPTFYRVTLGRPDPQLNYGDLAAINWDHFGVDARTAYNAGHWTALKVAANGDLNRAYAMDAFACHFLEDSFSGGHIRTPRRLLHKSSDPFADLCAKLMHDEENAIGLRVGDPSGKTWAIYGDKRLLDIEDDENRARCMNAVQASANEIWAAYKGNSPQYPNYSAWQHAPVLPGSQENNQALAELFRFEDAYRRTPLTHRRMDSSVTYTNDYWYWSTYAAAQKSGCWNYPITMDCYDHEQISFGGKVGTEAIDEIAKQM